MSEKKFDIYKDGNETPVTYTDEILADFRGTKAGLMDQEIDKVWDATFGAGSELDQDEGRLGIVAHLLNDALDAGDNQRISQCVLWLKVRYPEISGLNILLGQFHFQSEGNTTETSKPLH